MCHCVCKCQSRRGQQLNFKRLNLDLFVAQNGVVLELRGTAASHNRHSCQFADKRAERGCCDESYVVLCVK